LWSRAAHLGLNQSSTAFRLALRLRLFEVTLGLVSLWLGAGLYVLLIIHAVSWLTEAGLSFAALSRMTRVPIRFDATEFHSVCAEGFVLGLTTISATFLTAMPLILTRHLTGDLATVGQLGVAMQVAALAVMAAQGMLSAALPVVGRASVRGDPRLRHYSVLVALGTVIIFAPAIFLARAFGPAVVPALLGQGFSQAGTLLAPALLVGGLMVLPSGAWQILVSKGRRWPGVVAGWTAALILLAALPPLARASGASRVLTASALAWGVRSFILFFWVFAREKHPRT